MQYLPPPSSYGGRRELSPFCFSVQISNDWEHLLELPNRRQDYTMVAIGNERIALVGGRRCSYATNGGGGGTILNDVDVWNLRTKTWHKPYKMIEERYSCAAVAIGYKLFIFGGWNGKKVLSSCEMLDLSGVFKSGTKKIKSGPINAIPTRPTKVDNEKSNEQTIKEDVHHDGGDTTPKTSNKSLTKNPTKKKKKKKNPASKENVDSNGGSDQLKARNKKSTQSKKKKDSDPPKENAHNVESSVRGKVPSENQTKSNNEPIPKKNASGMKLFNFGRWNGKSKDPAPKEDVIDGGDDTQPKTMNKMSTEEKKKNPVPKENVGNDGISTLSKAQTQKSTPNSKKKDSTPKENNLNVLNFGRRKAESKILTQSNTGPPPKKKASGVETHSDALAKREREQVAGAKPKTTMNDQEKGETIAKMKSKGKKSKPKSNQGGIRSVKSRSLPVMSEAKYQFAAVVYDKTNVVILGGWNGTNLATVEMFDTINNRWTNLPSMPTARDCLSARLVAGSQIVAAGGYTTFGPSSTIEILDMETQIWRKAASMNVARHYFGSAVIGHSMNTFHMVVAGGMGIKSTEVYNFKSRQWSPLPRLNSTSDWRQLVAINDEMLIAGGEKHLEIMEIFWL